MSSEGNGIGTMAPLNSASPATPPIISREEVQARIRRAKTTVAVLYCPGAIMAEQQAEAKTGEGRLLSDAWGAVFGSTQTCINELIDVIEVLLARA